MGVILKMPFQPKINQELAIDGVSYRIAEHPAAPGMPYGQEGRQAIVYQLVTGEARYALKVFKPRYRVPMLASLADRLKEYAGLPGLSVCHRTVLTPERHAVVLKAHPDLTYAVLMSWIEGPTWMQVLLEKQELAAEDCLALARCLAQILSRMEQEGLAHCDLSGPNLLLPALLPSTGLGRGAGDEGAPLSLPGRGAGGEGTVALVDVEQMYGPTLRRLPLLPGGSPGYAHKTAPDGLWAPDADRFAGAILLAEMLGWCDGRVREASWGENYFDPAEMQQDADRYRLLAGALQERWGAGVAVLFERAWRSETLADCGTFGEWLVTLPEKVPVAIFPLPPVEEEPVAKAADDTVKVLLDLGRRLEEQGNVAGALEAYRQAQLLAVEGSGLAEELRLIVQDLEAKQAIPPVATPRPPVETETVRPPQKLPGEKPEGVVVSPLQPIEQAGLDTFFDDGLAAYRRGEWARARELLAEVVRQRPGYVQSEHRAQALLAEVEKRLAAPPRMSGWALWFWWVVANAVGWAAGLAVGCGTIWIYGCNATVAGALVGAVSGAAQWLVLRRQAQKAGWWVLASTVGWTLGMAIGRVIIEVGHGVGITAVMGWAWTHVSVEVMASVCEIGALAGAISGLPQWLILRGQVQKAGWWVSANTIGWAVGWVVGLAMGESFYGPGVGLVGGAISGVITGAALVWLLGMMPATPGRDE